MYPTNLKPKNAKLFDKFLFNCFKISSSFLSLTADMLTRLGFIKIINIFS